MFRWSVRKILPLGKGWRHYSQFQRMTPQITYLHYEEKHQFYRWTTQESPPEPSPITEQTDFLDSGRDILRDCPASPGCTLFWPKIYLDTIMKKTMDKIKSWVIKLPSKQYYRQIKQVNSSRLNDTFTTHKLNGIYNLWKDLRLRGKKWKTWLKIAGNSEHWLYIWLYYLK